MNLRYKSSGTITNPPSVDSECFPSWDYYSNAQIKQETEEQLDNCLEMISESHDFHKFSEILLGNNRSNICTNCFGIDRIKIEFTESEDILPLQSNITIEEQHVKYEVSTNSTQEFSVKLNENYFEAIRIHLEALPNLKNYYVCDICFVVYGCLATLQKHKTLHIVEDVNFKVEDFDVKNQVVEDAIEVKKQIKIFKCMFCVYSSTKSSHYKRHMITHTGDLPYDCSLCPFKCLMYRDLIKHRLYHSNGKLYKCDICTYRSYKPSHLASHMLIHTGVKNFKCIYCGYECYTSSNLKVHIMTHTGERPYRCDVCQYRCVLAGDLKRHKMMHTGEKPYMCDICLYKSNYSSNVIRHREKHMFGKPYYKCQIYCRSSK